MNQPNPLLPSGSSSGNRKHRKTKILAAACAVVAVHVLLLSPFLVLQGCQKSEEETEEQAGMILETPLPQTNEQSLVLKNPETNLPAPETNAPDSSLLNTNLNEESAGAVHSELIINGVDPASPDNSEFVVSGEISAPLVKPDVSEPSLPEAPASFSLDYTIRSGDTLYDLARAHGTTVDAILNANPGLEARRLLPGRSIVIPRNADSVQSAESANAGSGEPDSGKVYSVERGDTLIHIARQNGITLQALREANELRSDRILVGQKLKIPVAEVAVAR